VIACCGVLKANTSLIGSGLTYIHGLMTEGGKERRMGAISEADVNFNNKAAHLG
jgi:hypothetical protein